MQGQRISYQLSQKDVMSDAQSQAETLLTTLEGRSCEYCDDGTLERGTYEGNRAVVCTECGAPSVQLW